jgi:hypothetical protein
VRKEDAMRAEYAAAVRAAPDALEALEPAKQQVHDWLEASIDAARDDARRQEGR